ncbi:CHAT domain-containing protein [Sorangium sp. So ce1335]|uniref:CHAT domain-containing protein n=1 Tax=Sorangium sp. So ce1335 TaxID=3133335 RepID=UPI003F63277D
MSSRTPSTSGGIDDRRGDWRPGRAAPAVAPRAAALSLLGLAVLACGGDARHRTAPERRPLPLEVELAGCAAVLAGPVCELPDDRTIRVWIRVPAEARASIALDAAPVAPGGVPFQGGVLTEIHAPEGARELAVTAEGADARASFRARLLPPGAAPALDEADALRRQGKLDEAAALLVALSASPDPATRARATGKLARVDLARGRIQEAIPRFDEAIRSHRAAGRISDEFLDRFALSYALLYNGRRFTEARAALDALGPLEASHPEGRAMKHYYAALVSFETGDLRSALRQLDASAEGAERLGLRAHRRHVMQQRADVLQSLGRAAEARALLREVQASTPPGAPPCERASLLNDVGWNALHVAEAGGSAEDGPGALEQAIALYSGPCPRPAGKANALTNLALLALYARRPAEARAHLDGARRAAPSPDARLALHWLDIEGRIALGRGDGAGALRTYERLARLAELSALAHGRYRAALGRGEALEALGRLDEADAAYAAAESVRGELGLLAPLGEGRGTYLGRLEESARLRVDLLLRRDPARALGAARRSRGRALAALAWSHRIEALGAAERARWEGALAAYRRAREAFDAEDRQDWRLASDELERATAARQQRHQAIRATLDEALAVLGRAAPEPAGDGALALPALDEGELMLIYHRVRDGWAGFAVTRAGVTARRLGATSAAAGAAGVAVPAAGLSAATPAAGLSAATPAAGLSAATPAAELSAALLDPFRESIAAARRIRFVPSGALEQVDFHALPWVGAPLIAHAPVTYSMDLPGRSAGAAAPRAGDGALVVVDPRGDLPAARREGERVAGALSAEGLLVARLSGGAATHPALRHALERPGIAVFHHAGHGAFGGRDGWDSSLPLAAGGELAVGDVLALRQVPARIVLSGCDTARTAATAGDAGLGLGLAQAFLLAGAGSVIATTRPVNDAVAEQITSTLYNNTGFATADAGARLREAVLAARRAAPSSDWASFRALVP